MLPTEKENKENAYTVVVGSADTNELALVNAIDVELLEDRVCRRGAKNEQQRQQRRRERLHLQISG